MSVWKSVIMSISRTTMKNTTSQASRPDWILYTVPSIAFVFGLVMFMVICKTQRRRETELIRRIPAVKTAANGTTKKQNDTCSRYTETQSETKNSLAKVEAQSYENVSSAIYSNQNKTTYYLSPDEDYIIPDAMGGEATASEQNYSNYLKPPQNTMDADGESYENMEGCVYAQPRKTTKKRPQSPEDDESYENMEGNANSLKLNPAIRHSTQTLDDESYVRMDSIKEQNNGWTERSVRGERDHRSEGERDETQWYFRPKAFKQGREAGNDW